GQFLAVAKAERLATTATDPSSVVARMEPGAYVITRFVSHVDEAGERANAYVLERRTRRSQEDS
ncbi:MAG TPA: hypothetical protein VFQ80_14425, partial [Thermomicrobiales bacterium]|nr:hypothetical protein [Thermomicrobiales bacterium]